MEVTNYKEVDINIEGKVMEVTATGKFEKADYEMIKIVSAVMVVPVSTR